MSSLFLRRVLAFVIDYIVIITYAVLLFLASSLLMNRFNIDLNFGNPFKNQIIGFFTLTLPVFLYFYLSEKGIHKATLGKRVLRLKVVSAKKHTYSIFLRNFLKFLPWEIAHIGVYQIVFFENQQQETPHWVWFLLITPQVLVLIYFVSTLISKGKKSIYDRICNTELT
ncbi:MAG: RDD family protein [Flavobacteriaceae bacterium]